MKKEARLQPFIRQFYRGNGWRFALAMMFTLCSTAAAMMISWLIQQIIDLTTGVDIGFTFSQIVILAAAALLLDAAAWGIGFVCCLLHIYCTAGVLRRPNSSFYLAAILAAIYYLVTIKKYEKAEK